MQFDSAQFPLLDPNFATSRGNLVGALVKAHVAQPFDGPCGSLEPMSVSSVHRPCCISSVQLCTFRFADLAEELREHVIALSAARELAALRRVNRLLYQLVTKRLALMLQPLETSPYNLRHGYGVTLQLNRLLYQLVTKRLALTLQPFETSPYNLRHGYGVTLQPSGFCTLQCLHLANKGLGDKEATLLAAGALALPQLTQVDLSFNKIGDTGARALARAANLFGAFERVECWLLSMNEIDDEGLGALAGAAGAMPRLKHLYLNRNKFGDDGVTALAAALTKGSWGSLRLITLHDTATTDRGGKALSNAAKDGYLPKLTFLNLSGTDVQASTKDHIMASYAYFSCSVL